jgi:hypothetical protein
MKNALRSTLIAMIFPMILFSFGCERKTAVTNSGSGNQQESRESTKPLEAADLVGYDGIRLKKSVDRIIDSQQKHNQQLEKMSEAGPDQ